MSNPLDTVRLLVVAQLFATAFLTLVLWSLYARLRRQEFNRWWACAWTAQALFLLVGRIALMFPRGWTFAKGAVILLSVILGFVVVPMLVFGAMTFRTPGRVSRRLAFAGLASALALGVVTFGVSFAARAQPMASFAIRHGVRALLLTAAFGFAAVVLLRWARASKSKAALLAGACCLGYAISHAMHVASLAALVIAPGTGAPEQTRLVALMFGTAFLGVDVVLACGVCLGMMLLVVDEFRRSEGALTASVSRERRAIDENSALQLEIRAREQIERELRASEDRYRDLVEHSEDLICTHDLDGRILSCNPAPARILGYEVREILEMSLRDLLLPEFRHRFDAYIDTLMRKGVAKGLMRVVTRTGQPRIWAFHNTLRRDGVAAPIVRGMARDVTDQHDAAAALRRSEEKFAVAFRLSPCAMAISTFGDGRFLDVNETFEQRFGFERAEALGRTAAELGMWRDLSERDAHRNALFEHGRSEMREVHIRASTGDVITLLASAHVVTVGGERCVLWAGLDVTARKETEARNRAILKTLPDWVFLTHNGVFVECHVKDETHLLMPPGEFLGRHVLDVLPTELATRCLACYDEALRSEQGSSLEYSLWIDDEHRFYEVRCVRAEGDQVLSLVRDVTDRKQAELRARELQDELAHAGRAMALGTLAGSLAHEINQPLAAIGTNAHAALRMLEVESPDVEAAREAIEDIISDDGRIDAVLRRLRLLLRKDRPKQGFADVNDIVSDVLSLVHSSLIERRIAVDVAVEPKLPQVFGDRVQLQQVVLNLVMNAAEASTAAADAHARRIRVTTSATGTKVVVSVADNGPVVSEDELAQMFDPFYTTKQDGMGLGLTISRAIMDAHGGKISAVRNPERGLTFSFSLAAVSPVAGNGAGTHTTHIVESVSA
jgi:PAS domain S-box-containing protein